MGFCKLRSSTVSPTTVLVEICVNNNVCMSSDVRDYHEQTVISSERQGSSPTNQCL
ncbi:hypothetical protein PGTUg99_013889 [Puccinia graminis f. sp. tritici]|uniref:Uncharacterized protein n=1 Tax=Puccinia graminis f. sp. tritici TaxID=56615 RepID=A0A5B0PVJ4_PUCGR|nr:hypothetical protein PGTUg99_013889 [Puccinia graminis f. sp. tritici]